MIRTGLISRASIAAIAGTMLYAVPALGQDQAADAADAGEIVVNDANPQSLADGYALLGARLTINGANDNWSLSVFGRNLANQHYRPLAVYQPLGGALALNNGVFPGSTANRIQASEPRTYGVSATVRF